MKLWSYFRSSASYRVRIALHYKRLSFEYQPVHLINNGGEQNQGSYRKVNPMGHVPALELEGKSVSESMAIIDLLESKFPAPPLYPSDPFIKAKSIQIAELINSGIQPLQNLKVNQVLQHQFGMDKTSVQKWNQFWIAKGLDSLETIISETAGAYCIGDQLTIADCFLIPQCFSSRRFGVEIDNYPTIKKIESNALQLEAVIKAHPENQPDFQV
jgi:maleylacetoacetate isomerase